MSAGVIWPRILAVAGLAGMLIGALDPLEGCVIIFAGAGLLALSALVGGSRYRVLLYWSFALVAAGVAAMLAISQLGGIGGRSGRSLWFGLFILPYPAGWVMGLAGGVLRLKESFRRAARITAPPPG